MRKLHPYQVHDPAKGMFLVKPQHVKTVRDRKTGRVIGQHMVSPADRDSSGVVRYAWSEDYLLLPE